MAYAPTEVETKDAMGEDTTAYWSTEEEVSTALAKRRKMADKTQVEWRELATEIYQFIAGEQWSEEDRAYADKPPSKPLVTFNRVGPIMNAVCGQQICNRQEPRFLPRQVSDAPTAQLLQDVVAWARQSCDAEDEESDAFRDMVSVGIGWTCTTISYDEDPAGMVIEQRVDPRRMRWDPASRKKNLADARWMQCDYWYSRDEIKERWPNADELELDPTKFARGDSAAGGGMHDATNAWRYEENAKQNDLVDGKYRCIHEIHWRLEDVYQVAEPASGQITQLSKDEWDSLQSRLTKLGVEIPPAAQTKMRRYYEAWQCGATVLAFGPYPDKTPEYQAMTGLRSEEGAWYGLAAPLMDPQRFANKVFTQLINILNNNAKGGLIAEEGAVNNKAKFEENWSKSDGVSWVNDGAVANGRIQPKAPPQIPAELTKLLEYSVGGMREVTGVNVEFLGQTDKVQPGVVEAMRTKAGLVILAPWFDAMRLYLKRQGRLLAEYINKYIADGRMIRINGELGPQFVQLVKQPDTLKYDIVVDESTQSRDSRERYFQALLQIMPMALQQGIPIPKEVIDYAPLPEELRIKWKQELQKAEAAPKQPPLALQIEQMRGQTQAHIEEMRAQAKLQNTQMENQLKQQQSYIQSQSDHMVQAAKAESERVVQAAQAESQRMVDASAAQLDAFKVNLQMASERDKMLLQARLDTFQTILDAMVKLQTENQSNQMQAATNVQAESANASQIIPLMNDMMSSHKEDMANLFKVLSAPVEMTKDEKTGTKRVRRVLQ